MRPEFYNSQNWSSRGFLPHYDAGEKYQVITYRLADSLPVHKITKPLSGKKDKNSGSTGGSPVNATERRKEIDSILDKGYGSCILKQPEIAKIVIENWKHFDGKRYDLI